MYELLSDFVRVAGTSYTITKEAAALTGSSYNDYVDAQNDKSRALIRGGLSALGGFAGTAALMDYDYKLGPGKSSRIPTFLPFAVGVGGALYNAAKYTDAASRANAMDPDIHPGTRMVHGLESAVTPTSNKLLLTSSFSDRVLGTIPHE